MEATHHRTPIPPKAALIFGILAVSTASIFIRFAQAEAPSLTIAAYRLTLATIILAPFALRSRLEEIRQLSRKQLVLLMASGGFLAIHFASWITSLEHTSVASSIVFVSTDPLWVAILSPLLLRERLSRPVIIGLLITLLGGTLVGLSDGCTWSGSGLSCPTFGQFFQGEAIYGNFLALVGAWMAAGYLIIGRKVRADISLVTYTFLVYGVAAVVLIGMAVTSGTPMVGFSPSVYLLFLALAVIPQLLGHSTFNWALRYLPATLVSIALLGEPIGSTILAYFILGEVPGGLKIGGAAIILVGIWVASRSQK